ncbi:hypothetical protein GCM10008090_29570 [Arenicella chitinivorans]|uniref:Uncharacterized protein n=1 Tax=Arenicella chitinivorans TaxID=1329800 RepID=A0A918S0D6_9GAMM|nr:hypothetical protein [Arenicella chitinivorans]GHA17930.1 hypothetical protein GCM10008090_29570 [Arenicella chitinivorans]
MNTCLRNVVMLLSLLWFSSAAYCGDYQPAELKIDLEARQASGDMFTVRHADDDKALIGCGVRHYLSGNEVIQYGFCQANSSAMEVGAFCETDNPAMVAAISAITTYSYIVFHWDKAGECTFIGNSSQSFYLPKS